jgi:hypothetical protein
MTYQPALLYVIRIRARLAGSELVAFRDGHEEVIAAAIGQRITSFPVAQVQPCNRLRQQCIASPVILYKVFGLSKNMIFMAKFAMLVRDRALRREPCLLGMSV